MAFAQDVHRLNPYRKLLLELSSELSSHDLEKLKFASIDLIPRGTIENISSGLKFFDVLEQDGRITPQYLSLLADMLETIGRVDLAWKIQCFSTSPSNNADSDADEADNMHTNDVVTDGGGDESKRAREGEAAEHRMRDFAMDRPMADEAGNMHTNDVVTDGGGDESKRAREGKAAEHRMRDFAMKRPMDEAYNPFTDDEITDGGDDESKKPQAATGKRPRTTRDFARNHPREESQVLHEEGTFSGFTAVPAVEQRLVGSAPNTFFASGGDGGAIVAARTMHKSSGGNDGSSSVARGPDSAAPVSAPAPAPAAPVLVPGVTGNSQTQTGQHSRLQHDSSVAPAPVRYVNYLAYQGYSVEIIGGKHFKTPEGEFVEIKSGTQYKIHVKNSRAYGCNLDISIDGYDVGGWVVDGGQELTIERPAYEAKKFTFYRVKIAPKEAGIESGRSENGVVKCVFTPEALLDVPVVIPGLPEPLKVHIAPSATVGDLKREVQSQLEASPDPNQILAHNDQFALSNFTRLSNVLKSPGNLRLVDTELQITVETSSGENFPIKIQPGKEKVVSLMQQIERKLDVPIKDQKLYHGKSRLSDAPQRSLPQELVCSLQPTVVVIVPEYIRITVEDLSGGEARVVKIDKEKTLTDLMEEIPACRNLQENEEAVFFFNGRKLYPSSGEEALARLGVCSGSKLEFEVKVIFIKIYVTMFSMRGVQFRCTPEETFKDLLYKIQTTRNTGMLEGAMFATQERVFDPEQDIGPLQEYGIKHGSKLTLRMAEPQPNEGSAGPGGDEASQSGPEVEEIEELVAHGKKQSERLFERLLGLSASLCTTWDGWNETSNIEEQQRGRVLFENDPAWKAGGTTLQGHSFQQFIAAEPIKVDPSKKVELVLRLVAREDETDLVFPKDEFKPLSTLYPPAVPE